MMYMMGIVIDFGIEFGKLFYWNWLVIDVDVYVVIVNCLKLWIYVMMFLLFFVGGLVGVIGFKCVGYVLIVLFVVVFVMFVIVLVIDDLFVLLCSKC